MSSTDSRVRPPVVLVVDDEALLRMLATDYFRDAGYEVIEAENGDVALETLRARPDIRAIFTDVQMPGDTSGIQLAARARAECPDCAIVVVSGRQFPRQSELAAGVRFVAKPYYGADIVRMFDGMLSRH